jgi:hypothetical protein
MWSAFIWRRIKTPLFHASTISRRSKRGNVEGYLKLPNGCTLTGHSRDYRRNATSY